MPKHTSRKDESSQVTARRKRDHVDIVLKKDVVFHDKGSGFEYYDFIHNALPELNYSEIDLSTSFLGKDISAPLLISCMTGGYEQGKDINELLAQVCEELQIPLGVGSQRVLLRNPDKNKSFSIVRETAPTIPILGNIGGTEVASLASGEYRLKQFQHMVSVIGANALVVHLNPLQELLQPEGNTNFRGVLQGIKILVKELSCPVIVKEVGAGLSGSVIKRLYSAGIRYIDVAGAGGTSWSAVEITRRNDSDNQSLQKFWEWGIPTVESLQMAVKFRKKHPQLHITASGGISDGVTAAKAVALGADLAGSARIFLQELMKSGTNGLMSFIRAWMEDMKRVMFLTGSRTIKDLQKSPMVYRKQL